jgi:hypothetical protein
MTAFNVVRFRIKPGLEESFVARHRDAGHDLVGLRRGALIKTGDRAFCFIAEWNAMADIVNARPKMIEILDSLRDMLEDLGSGLGVTDPVSGEAVVEINPPKPARRKNKTKPRKTAARRPAKKARKKRAKRK